MPRFPRFFWLPSGGFYAHRPDGFIVPLINRFGRGLRSIWRPSIHDEVEQDLGFHVEMRVRELVQAGMAPEMARAEAIGRFGNIEEVKAECRGIGMKREREMRIKQWWNDWRQDLRHTRRQLLGRPGFAAAIVVTIGIGVGSSTTIFSAVDSVLLRPLPFAEQDRVVSLWQTGDQDGSDRSPVSPGNYLDWRDRNQSFSALAEAEPWSYALTGQGDPEVLPTWAVTRDFFKALGVDPILGRTFLPEEFEEGNGKVVVLSHKYWQRRFGGNPRLVGSTLMLDEEAFLVAGIMPPDFEFPPGRPAWRPRVIGELESEMRARNWLQVVGRLRPQVSLDEAQADMDRVASLLADEYPATNRNTGVLLEPITETIVGRARAPLYVLFAAAGLLLLIACTNVAGLLLARGSRRERELALRAALGAGRERLMRQLITEGVVLGVLGGIVGVGLAVAGTRFLGALGASELPRVEQLQLDARVLSFAAILSVLTVLLFGLGPAIHFSRPNLRSYLSESGRGSTEGSTSQRLRGLLVAGQIAITLVLLAGAGLLSRSFLSLTHVDPGFEPHGRVAVSLHVWDTNRTPEERIDFFGSLRSQVTGLPGVQSAAASSVVPFGRSSIETDGAYQIVGRPPASPGDEPLAYFTEATPMYFETMGIPVREGRSFSEADNRAEASPVILVSESLAAREWPEASPLGAQIDISEPGDEPVLGEIVGVVGDVRPTGFDSEPRAEIFIPHGIFGSGSMTFVARTEVDAGTLVEQIKQEVWKLHPAQAVYSGDRVVLLMSESLQSRRFVLYLISVFAVLSVVLSAVGVYALVSFSTQQRTGEIGVRKALGADTGRILGMVMRKSLLLAGLGIAAGLVAAIGLGRFLDSMLYGVEAADPLTLAAVVLLVGVFSAIATLVPASRAARIDPAVALRAE